MILDWSSWGYCFVLKYTVKQLMPCDSFVAGYERSGLNNSFINYFGNEGLHSSTAQGALNPYWYTYSNTTVLHRRLSPLWPEGSPTSCNAPGQSHRTEMCGLSALVRNSPWWHSVNVNSLCRGGMGNRVLLLKWVGVNAHVWKVVVGKKNKYH